MSHDFEKIAADMRVHFCPQCKASFGCEIDEDRDCNCIGQEYADNWRKPWCPACVEKEECTSCPRFNCRCSKCSECTCSDCREERRLRESGDGPYDEKGPSSEASARDYDRDEIIKFISESFKRDICRNIGKKL